MCDIVIKKTWGMIRESLRGSNLDWVVWEHESEDTFRLRLEVWVGANQVHWGKKGLQVEILSCVKACGSKNVKVHGAECLVWFCHCVQWGVRAEKGSGVQLEGDQDQMTRSPSQPEEGVLTLSWREWGRYWSVWAVGRHDQICTFKKFM